MGKVADLVTQWRMTSFITRLEPASKVRHWPSPHPTSHESVP